MFPTRAFRALLLIVGAAALLGLSECPAELGRRAALPSDLKPALAALTPDRLVERCGAPSSDAISNLVFRELVYERDRVAIRFFRAGPGDRGWNFASLRERINGRLRPSGDPRQTLASFPCLSSTGAGLNPSR